MRDFIPTNKEELVRDVTVWDEKVKLRLLKDANP